MAATNTVRIMENGPRNTILWIEGNNGATGASPGAGGADLAYTTILLPAGVGYVNRATKEHPTGFRIDKIEWDIQTEQQMRVDLWWDASPSADAQIAYSCIGRANKCFKDFGGLYPPAGITGKTGGLGLSTTGSPTTYGAWTIVLYLVNLLNPA
jgi:hypothetical protein